ncbi:hypothetical protein O0J71_05905 [Stenotrophomonas sp. Sm3119]|uniref:hypothetical protein n=1 Tax=Stenotrophomonas sp. Sm3119 TaxID=3002744 RepID=UPI0027E50B9C|nr:hypothetical protein [Stenotrophomonas sp. Sm3119]MDQ7306464.1 hypothetical protein [Stenotrophomonas sp. Sm3119]
MKVTSNARQGFARVSVEFVRSRIEASKDVELPPLLRGECLDYWADVHCDGEGLKKAAPRRGGGLDELLGAAAMRWTPSS